MNEEDPVAPSATALPRHREAPAATRATSPVCLLYIHAHIHIRIHTCTCTCTCTYAYTYIHIHIFIHIHILPLGCAEKCCNPPSLDAGTRNVRSCLGLESGFEPTDLDRPGRLPQQQGPCEARLGYRDGSPLYDHHCNYQQLPGHNEHHNPFCRRQ